jgi:hypothetical protein
MFIKSILFASTFTAFCGHSLAAPLTFENDVVKVVVVRPIDLWSGDKSALESSLEAHKNKTTWYTVLLNNQKYIFGNPNITQSATVHPITIDVSQKLNQLGFKLPRSSDNSFTIQLAVAVPSEKMKDVQSFQAKSFNRTVIAQGDPDALQAKTSRNKFFGGVFSLAATLVAADKFGTSFGAHAIFGSGISESLYNEISQYNGGLVPVDIGSDDLSQFKQIEIRRVTTAAPDRNGQIVIAYKQEKTPAIEESALALAIVALTAANSSTAEIEQARAEDYAQRKEIWKQCVSEGGPACKP